MRRKGELGAVALRKGGRRPDSRKERPNASEPWSIAPLRLPKRTAHILNIVCMCIINMFLVKAKKRTLA